MRNLKKIYSFNEKTLFKINKIASKIADKYQNYLYELMEKTIDEISLENLSETERQIAYESIIFSYIGTLISSIQPVHGLGILEMIKQQMVKVFGTPIGDIYE